VSESIRKNEREREAEKDKRQKKVDTVLEMPLLKEVMVKHAKLIIIRIVLKFNCLRKAAPNWGHSFLF